MRWKHSLRTCLVITRERKSVSNASHRSLVDANDPRTRPKGQKRADRNEHTAQTAEGKSNGKAEGKEGGEVQVYQDSGVAAGAEAWSEARGRARINGCRTFGRKASRTQI